MYYKKVSDDYKINADKCIKEQDLMLIHNTNAEGKGIALSSHLHY